ncbi:MAG: hypothetical protein VKK04_20800 [Synechococcales bacterium]|nr:hypothetical protein [Synechococcales bacterium]
MNSALLQIARADADSTHPDSRVPNLSRPRDDDAIPYEIFEMGHWILASGLMARPLVDEFDLELPQDSEEYSLEGEWFPFVICCDELEFIVSEDGTIFVAVAKNAGELTLVALRRLFEVCELIYRESECF